VPGGADLALSRTLLRDFRLLDGARQKSTDEGNAEPKVLLTNAAAHHLTKRWLMASPKPVATVLAGSRRRQLG